MRENEKKMKMLVFSEDEEDSEEDIEEEKQAVNVQNKEEAINRRVICTPSYERPSPSQDYSSKSSKIIPESNF